MPKKKTTKTKTAVATTKTKNTLPATLADEFLTDAGLGHENVTQDDMVTPFLKIAEKMHDEVDKTKPNYIEGLEPGMIFNSATRRFFKTVTVVPLFYQRLELEWAPKRGGLRGIHLPSAGVLATAKRDNDNKDILPNGNEIIVTGQQFVWVHEGEGAGYPALISFTKTRLKYSKQWNSAMKSLTEKINGKVITPPRFGTTWELTTKPDSNDQGSWFTWNMEYKGVLTDLDQYQAMKTLSESIAAGNAKVNYDEDNTTTDKTEEAEEVAF